MSDTPYTAVKRKLFESHDERFTKRQMGGHGEPISSGVAKSQEAASSLGHLDPPSPIPRGGKTKEAKDTDSGNTKAINSGVKGQHENINSRFLQISFRERVKSYHSLCDYKSEDLYRDMMAKVLAKWGEELYAQALHDSPAKLRQAKLTEELIENRDSDLHRRLIRNITDLEIHRDIVDPCYSIPPVVTKRFLEVFLKREREKGDKRLKIQCHCCNEEFCTLEGLHDVENVVWKLCGKHLMHEQCFIDAVRKNSIPLYGSCGCEDLVK